MLRILFVGLFSIWAVVGNAQEAMPERRLVVSQNVDFYGGDLQTMFDTSLEACQAVCLGNPQCQAFTFNSRKNVCFPKTGISDRVAYDGAISAEVRTAGAATLQLAASRQAELAFLTKADNALALSEAKLIGPRHSGGDWAVEDLLNTARAQDVAGNTQSALIWYGAAVAQSDAPELWADYARLSLVRAEQVTRYSDRTMHNRRALGAAINAYLRAGQASYQVLALTTLAEALEANDRGRDMIPALRLALSLQSRADVAAMLDDAVGKYGFRIIEHEVLSNAAGPQICAQFSEDLIKTGMDYTPFVRLPDQTLAVTSDDRRVCVTGIQHGERYTVTFRSGLPSQSGEETIKDVTLTLYVPDRAPSAVFAGRAYVLPKTADAGIPIETVNTNRVNLSLRRVSDRNLLRAVQESYFGRPLSYWEEQHFTQDIAEEIWTGVGEVSNQLNQSVVTRLPMGEAISDLPAGVYALTASLDGADPYDDPGATQWFVLSDIGMTTLSGNDGLTVFTRHLTDATPFEGLTLQLVSRANRVLGSAVTDAQGYAVFAPGLMRGTGGAAPAMIMAEQAGEDFAFLSLTDPAFDLSDRGVEGRDPAGPIDVFLSSERGAYRAGEHVRATALLRDAKVSAIEDLPVTAVLTRPDGVEYSRHFSGTSTLGGHVFDMPIATTAPRGQWQLALFADTDAPALAKQSFLVEDFIPERIDFDLTLPDGLIDPLAPPPLEIAARYLFGAPGADLPVEGEVLLRPMRSLPEVPGYQFGRYDDRASPNVNSLQGDLVTDASGRLSLPLILPDPDLRDRPYQAEVTVRVSEGSGRPVERRIERMMAAEAPIIGIKPLFDGVVAEGTEAVFEVRGFASDLSASPMPVNWTLNRVQTRYQWYQEYGSWRWEPITTRRKVASGAANLASDPTQIAARVDWGRYELVVERSGGAYTASSVDFYAGWYAPADTSATPDTLELSLDKPTYRTGETATLRLVPRYAGKAIITVLSDRVISMKAVDVSEGETLVSLDVTDEWGGGAYVTASVIRPMDVATGQNPSRALGLAHAAIDPGARKLGVAFDAPEEAAPRGPLTARLTVDGLAQGDTAWATVAAVDVGILNLTGFDSPDPSSHYFGQRRLGVDIRDVYGRLINGMDGAMGTIRSGGDAGSEARLESPPPTEELVAFFSGPVQVGPDGTAEVQFDLPEFNGTVRLMAIAWSKTAVGQAEADVLVRDPVVLSASLPRFLAPGDRSRLLLEITHAKGPIGDMGLTVSSEGLGLDTIGLPGGLTLTEGGSARLSVPLTAKAVGDHSITVSMTTPGGEVLEKRLTLGVRANDPEIAQTRRFALALGASFTLDNAVFDGFRAGSSEALISAGPLAQFDAPGLIASLNRYPYGCTEQVTSRALPMLYLTSVAEAMGLAGRAQMQARIDQSITKVLTRQSANGAFGLWSPGSGDFWLDAYVSDFLSRARAEGHVVPNHAFASAMDNLRNRVSYAPDFDDGGEDIAYALMVLAREGQAQMGDLRYYADVKAEAFRTPLSLAQLGSALAMYGDQTRADMLFARSARLLALEFSDETSEYRVDYGSTLRDAAGVLSLAVEVGSTAIDQTVLQARLNNPGRLMSTQEQSWALLAAHAMVQDPGLSGVTVDGAAASGPFVRRIEGAVTDPMVITNTGSGPTNVTLTTLGVPTVPGPASGYGYNIDRSYFRTDGTPLDGEIAVGDRFVTVLTIRPAEQTGARLMVNDALPAGFEIDNPNLIRSGDIRALDWLEPTAADHTEFRSDRFLAALDWRGTDPFRLAYVVRAVSPGEFHHPAATVEDMYRPRYRAQTDTGRIVIAE